MDEVPLTPSQRRVLDELMGAGRPRPTFDASLGEELRARMDEGLSGVEALLGDGDLLTVRKKDLSQVHACESHHLAELDAPFAWSARTARGSIAHRAIELSVRLAHLPAGDLVDIAIARLVEDGDDWSPASWLREAGEVDLADLRAYATDAVHKFQDEFPPVKQAWRPRVESGMYARLCDGRVTLRGKVDLALGQARGTEARVMIVDFKTGSPSSAHLDDLRYYALLETLRVGVPPFRLVSWYLDSGHWHAEDVTVDVLLAAARRTVDGTRKIAELRAKARTPEVNPGPACSFCVRRDDCEGAAVWAAQRDQHG